MEIQKYISRMSLQQFCDSLTAGWQQLCLFPDDETVTRGLEGTSSPYDICLEFPVVLCFSGAVSFPWSWSLQES